MGNNMDAHHGWLKMEELQFSDFRPSLWIAQSLVVLSVAFILYLAVGKDRTGHYRYVLIDIKISDVKKKTECFLLGWKWQCILLY